MTIRKYENKDWEKLSAFLSESMDYHITIAEPLRITKQSRKLISEMMSSMTARYRSGKGMLFVAVNDSDEPVGYIYGEVDKFSGEHERLARKSGTVEELYVIESARGQGLATRLLREMEKYLRKSGCKIIRLADVYFYNEPAQKLYESLGYVVRVHEYAKEL